jgi:predicted PurR-regulated permease PerM
VNQRAVDVPGAEPSGVVVRPAAPWDLTRTLLAVVAIGGLIAASFWILRPFLPAVVWATMVVVATWPALRVVQARLWGKRILAVTVMTLLMLAVLAAPVTMAVVAVVERADDVVAWTRMVVARGIPAPPAWVDGLPLVGAKIASEWRAVASTPPEQIAARVAPYLAGVIAWLFSQAGGLGVLLLQFLLTVAVSAMLYAQGETAAAGVLAFARRLAGEQGARVVILSAGAIRAVALGIVVTALVQSAVGGIGLAVTGVPHPLLLACIMVVLGIAQIGPWPVLFGAVVWLYVLGDGDAGVGAAHHQHGQHPAPHPDQAGRRPAAGAHPRRRARRTRGLRPGRPVRGARDPGGDLHAAGRVGERRRRTPAGAGRHRSLSGRRKARRSARRSSRPGGRVRPPSPRASSASPARGAP